MYFLDQFHQPLGQAPSVQTEKLSGEATIRKQIHTISLEFAVV